MLPSLLKFHSIVLPKPWGGDALGRVLGKTPGGPGIGESWELSDRKEAPTAVAEGPLAGKTLRELMAEHGPEIVGGKARAENFPLLLKFISAAEKLSVQVHPGDRSTIGEPKTEAWVAVEARPGAELILGVRSGGRNRDETLALLKSPRCEEVLRRWPVKAGDVFFVPAGTVHAIAEGLLLYEIQQNSDTTYRLYDWGRVDVKGNPRPLHLEQAASVADLREREGYKIEPLRIDRTGHVEDFLVACPFFAAVKWHGFRGTPVALPAGEGFRVLSVISGSLRAKAMDASLKVGLGETVLLRAGASASLEASEDAAFILSFVPELEKEIAAPLLAAGYNRPTIHRLFGPQ